MDERTVNTRLLKRLVSKRGRGGQKMVAEEVMMGLSTLHKLVNGRYGARVGKSLRVRLCQALNVKEDILFPPVGAGKGSRAS